jgi:peptidoglycan/xylan/chitin deacetylase (PgdA/CDA1 family)
MIRRLILSALTAVLAVAGVGCRASPGVQIPILMYHQVGDATDDFWTVPADEFEAQLRILKERGYETILPKDLANGSPLPANPLILTFDDGTVSLKTHVEPLLKKYGFRGVSYLITSLVGEDEAHRMQNEGYDCLTWPEVREMQARGTIVFGGHSHHHVRLSELPAARPEAETCFREMQNKGGMTPDSFCYPYGDYDNKTVEAVRDAGFTTAVTCGEHWADSRNSKLLKLPRLWIRGGRHEFTVNQLAVENGMALCRFQHKGIPIPVSIHLTWAGNPPGEIWQDATEIGTGSTEWSWKLPPPVEDPKSLRVEVWDKNRFFRLFTYP